MYQTNYLGHMTYCKEIALIRRMQKKHWSHKELFAQEELELRGSTSERRASNNTPDI